MQQLDLFGAVEEKKPQSNIEKVADADLNIVHVKEIENETEEKPAHYCAPKPKPTATTTMKNR